MKKLVICFIMAICCTAAGAFACEAEYLQVIGATDLQPDQEYKLLVRDWALELAAEGLTEPEAMETGLNRRAREHGREGNIRVVWGEFPDHEVSGRTCRVIIGEGCGRNWFGLLYPEISMPGEDVAYYSAIINWIVDIFDLF